MEELLLAAEKKLFSPDISRDMLNKGIYHSISVDSRIACSLELQVKVEVARLVLLNYLPDPCNVGSQPLQDRSSACKAQEV